MHKALLDILADAVSRQPLQPHAAKPDVSQVRNGELHDGKGRILSIFNGILKLVPETQFVLRDALALPFRDGTSAALLSAVRMPKKGGESIEYPSQ